MVQGRDAIPGDVEHVYDAFTQLRVDRIDLSNATLRSAVFRDVRCHGARFDGADLLATGWWGVDAVGARLRTTDLRGAAFRVCRLVGADLTSARVGGTIFSACDLSGVVGWESVIHEEALLFDVATIARTRDLPVELLERNGTAALRAPLIGCASRELPERHRVWFFSDSTGDSPLAGSVVPVLLAGGVPVWMDQLDLVGPHADDGGFDHEDMARHLYGAINPSDGGIVLLTRKSLASAWVDREMQEMAGRRSTYGPVGYPVLGLIADDLPEKWPDNFLRAITHTFDLRPSIASGSLSETVAGLAGWMPRVSIG